MNKPIELELGNFVLLNSKGENLTTAITFRDDTARITHGSDLTSVYLTGKATVSLLSQLLDEYAEKVDEPSTLDVDNVGEYNLSNHRQQLCTVAAILPADKYRVEVNTDEPETAILMTQDDAAALCISIANLLGFSLINKSLQE